MLLKADDIQSSPNISQFCLVVKQSRAILVTAKTAFQLFSMYISESIFLIKILSPYKEIFSSLIA